MTLKFINSEKAKKFCETSTVDLSYVCQSNLRWRFCNFMAISECMNLKIMMRIGLIFFKEEKKRCFWFLTLKNDHENQNFAIFEDIYERPFKIEKFDAEVAEKVFHGHMKYFFEKSNLCCLKKPAVMVFDLGLDYSFKTFLYLKLSLNWWKFLGQWFDKFHAI